MVAVVLVSGFLSQVCATGTLSDSTALIAVQQSWESNRADDLDASTTEVIQQAEETPLIDAILERDYENVRRLLNTGAAVDLRNRAGYTALHYAAVTCPDDIVALICEKGGDPNAMSIKGLTPLHLGVDRSSVIKTLLESGADPNVQDRKGRTPLARIFTWSRLSRNDPALTRMITELHNAGADLDLKDKTGAFPLFYAVTHLSSESVRLLLDLGANANLQIPTGESALMVAAWRIIIDPDNGEVSEIIRSLCAANANVLQKRNDGETALSISRRYGTKEGTAILVQELIDRLLRDLPKLRFRL